MRIWGQSSTKAVQTPEALNPILWPGKGNGGGGWIKLSGPSFLPIVMWDRPAPEAFTPFLVNPSAVDLASRRSGVVQGRVYVGRSLRWGKDFFLVA